ncbi:MAG: hypothetical protein ACJ735_00350 [Actinomycetes bacterium]
MERDRAAEYAAAVTKALAPHAWREMTTQMLARRAVAAVDQHSIGDLLANLPGARLLGAQPLEASDLDDSRVAVLVDLLEEHRWRECALDKLAVWMLGTLAAWQLDRDRLEAQLRELLGDF